MTDTRDVPVRILLVEGNALVRQALREALELHDLDVYEAPDCRQALSLIHGRKDQVDLVINDLVLPGMNALEFYEALEEAWGNVRMLIITGYPMPGSGEVIASRPGVSWVQKPVRFEEVGEMVRALTQNKQGQ